MISPKKKKQKTNVTDSKQQPMEAPFVPESGRASLAQAFMGNSVTRSR
jgi:hypothetical protein